MGDCQLPEVELPGGTGTVCVDAANNYLENVDFYGGSIPGKAPVRGVESRAVCKAKCRDEPQCVCFSFDERSSSFGDCYLKNEVGTMKTFTGVVSE